MNLNQYEEISLHGQKEALLNAQITKAEQTIQDLEQQKQKLEEQIEQKEAAKAEMHVLADKIQVLKKELVTAKKTSRENRCTRTSRKRHGQPVELPQ